MLCLLLFTKNQSAFSQPPKDSTILRIEALNAKLENGGISEKAYLDTMTTAMQSFLAKGVIFSNIEILGNLKTFRTITWSNKNFESYKRKYYMIFCNQAQIAGRLGEMLYYAEKINELEQIEKNQPSITALTVIADYYNTTSAYEHTKMFYEKYRPYILTIPEQASKGELEFDLIVQSCIMLKNMSTGLFNNHDTALGNEAIGVLDKIASIFQSKHSDNYNGLANIRLMQLQTAYEKGLALKSDLKVLESLKGMGELLNDEHTPDYLKNYVAFSITECKTVLYLKQKNLDSASHYLKLFEKQLSEEDNLDNTYTIQKFQARVLYIKGLYKASADTLLGAIDLAEQLRTNTVKDISEMNYAQAKAEEQQLMLIEAEQNRSIAEKKMRNIILGSISLIILGGLLWLYFRQRQRTKYLQFKLNIARNLHDETNPALLYAKALAKNSRADPELKSTLENHIEQTMEAIRSLSHDLKTDKLHTILELKELIEAKLKKLNVDDSFVDKVVISGDEKRFLSHYQFTHIRLSLQEAIANTIKHADYDQISIAFNEAYNLLKINYSDNGKGWPYRSEVEGIGIQNMRERILCINGEFDLKMDYPNGYIIEISAPLR